MKTTYIDRIHPAVAFGFFIAAIVIGVVLQHPIYLLLSLSSAFLLNVSLSGRKAIRQTLGFLPVAAIVALINPLFNTLGQTVLFSLWGRPYTLEALVYGGITGGMLLGMLLWFSAYNRVLTDDKFTYLFGSCSPSLSLLLTTVFRLIPNLTRKIRQILNARKAIGKSGNSTKDALQNGITAISVLTSWALEGSATTADSMNSRGYGTGQRTSFHHYRFTFEDWIITAVLFAALLLAAIKLLSGAGAAVFIPALLLAPPDPTALSAYAIFLLTPTLLNWKEDILWHFLRSKT